jgi:dihydrofolate synthase/folylpolyglutamate synthase
VDPRERIRVDCEKIAEEDFTSIFEHVRPFIRKEPGGYRTVFEVLTAISFIHFLRVRTDYTILEVGMGGRYDATNVVDPALTVVTPISLDHTHVLGSTVSEIAEKKMGVARPGIPVVCAPQNDEVLSVIESVCEDLKADLKLVGRDILFQVRELTEEGSRFTVGERTFSIPLLGEHQVVNAATVHLALEALGEEVRDDGFEGTELMGRLQIIDRDPVVLLDVAHNGHSAAALAKSIRDLFPGRRVAAVVSMLKKKDHKGFATELSPVVETLYATTVDSPRALSPGELATHFEGLVGSIRQVRDAKDALRSARAEAGEAGLVLVTGSFYLVGEILAEWGSTVEETC